MADKPPRHGARATREHILTLGLSEAEALLWRVSDALKEGRTPDPEDMRALPDLLSEILASADANSALGRKRKRGRKSQTSKDYERHVELVEQVIRKMDAGLTRDEAIYRVALEHDENMPEDTLRGYYQKHKNTARMRLAFQHCMDRSAAQLAQLQGPFNAFAKSAENLRAVLARLNRK